MEEKIVGKSIVQKDLRQGTQFPSTIVFSFFSFFPFSPPFLMGWGQWGGCGINNDGGHGILEEQNKPPNTIMEKKIHIQILKSEE